MLSDVNVYLISHDNAVILAYNATHQKREKQNNAKTLMSDLCKVLNGLLVGTLDNNRPASNKNSITIFSVET